MDVRILLSSASLSTSGGSWAKAEYANLSVDLTAANYDDCNTARTSAGSAVTNGVSLTGVCFQYRRNSTGGTVTFTLQEFISSWNDVAGTAVTINADTTEFPTSYGSRYVAFASPYTVPSGVYQYRVKISCSVATRLYWWRNATAANYSFALIGNGSSAKPASGDAILMQKGTTLTVDENWTLGPANGHSLIFGDGAIINFAPPSPITVNFGSGDVVRMGNSQFKCGSSGSRIAAQSLTIMTSLAAAGSFFHHWASSQSGAPSSLDRVLLYGAKADDIRIKASADAASGQNVINTVENIPATWTDGDIVTLVGKDKGTTDAVTYYFKKTGTTQMTLFNEVGLSTAKNLDAKLFAGAAIVNLSYGKRASGVNWISTNDVSMETGTNVTHDYNILDGVYMENIGPGTGNQTAASGLQSSYSNMLVYFTTGSYRGFITSSVTGGNYYNMHLINHAASVSGTLMNSKNSTHNKVTIKTIGANATANSNFQGTNVACDDWIVWHTGTNWCNPSGLYKFDLTNTLCINSGFSLIGVAGFNFENVKQHRGLGNGLLIGNASGTAVNCTFGIGTTTVGYDITWTPDTFSQIVMTNCNVGGKGLESNFTSTVDGSYLRFVNYNQTAGDNRAYYTAGHFASNSGKIDAFTDITTDKLENAYNISSDTIAGMSVEVSANCQINNAAYYAGTYTAPTMYVDYDNGTTTSVAAANNTTAQTLAASFSPTTSNNPLVVRFDQKTDASVANSKVTWDTLSLVARQYPYLEYAYSKAITATTDDIIANIPTPTNDPLVTVTNPATVAAYTGISFNHGAETITVTGAGGSPVNTGAMLYDACQYEFDRPSNLSYPKFFYSVDGGLSYISNYDVSISGNNITTTKTLRLASGKLMISNGYYWTGLVDGNIEISTPGTYNLKLDSNTLTFTAAGTYDLRGADIAGTITVVNTSGASVTVQLDASVSVTNTGPNITLDNTVATSIDLSSLVAGSTVRFYNSTGATELFNAVVAGTSKTHTLNYGGSPQSIKITVRKAGYKTWETTASLTEAGINLSAAQEVDPSYNAAYNAGMATDWAIDTTAKTVARLTTNWNTIRDFHSYYNYLFATTAYMQFDVPTQAFTKYEIQFVNGYTFDSATDFQKLKTGSIADPVADDLWGSVISLGNASTETLYLVQNGSKVTSYWSAGNIDVLIKVKASGSLIDSGKVHVFTRDYGRIYDHALLTITEGGKNYAPINTGADPNNLTASGSLPTITKTEATQTGKQIDVADTPGDYDFKIDAGGASALHVFEALKWLTEGTKTGTIHSIQGLQYVGWSAGYPELKNGPLATFVGGKLYGAEGLWIENIATADALNYQLTDNSGATHGAAAPPVAISAPNLIDDTRIQIYNVTQDTEIDNTVLAGGSGYSKDVTIGVEGNISDIIRMRATYSNGVTAKSPIESFGALSSAGLTFIDSQSEHAVYNTWGIDGSTVTEFTADYPNIQADANDADGETTKTRFGAWFIYNLTTEQGIASFFGGIETPAANIIRINVDNLDLHIQNVSALPLEFTDTNVRLYRSDAGRIIAAGTGSIEMDYTGVPDVVTVASETVNVWNEPPTAAQVAKAVDNEMIYHF